MSSTQWRYVLLDHLVGAAVLNFFLNAAIAWAIFRSAASVPFWGMQGLLADTIATSLILPVLTCVIVTRLTVWRVSTGRLTPLLASDAAQAFVGRFPARTSARAGVFALASFVLLVPATIAMLVWLDATEMPLRDFIFFKAAFAVASGTLVTPPIAVLALATRFDPP